MEQIKTELEKEQDRINHFIKFFIDESKDYSINCYYGFKATGKVSVNDGISPIQFSTFNHNRNVMLYLELVIDDTYNPDLPNGSDEIPSGFYNKFVLSDGVNLISEVSFASIHHYWQMLNDHIDNSIYDEDLGYQLSRQKSNSHTFYNVVVSAFQSWSEVGFYNDLSICKEVVIQILASHSQYKNKCKILLDDFESQNLDIKNYYDQQDLDFMTSTPIVDYSYNTLTDCHNYTVLGGRDRYSIHISPKYINKTHIDLRYIMPQDIETDYNTFKYTLKSDLEFHLEYGNEGDNDV